MKKRILAPLCACLLLLSWVLPCPARAASASDPVYFMVVNETVLDLRSDTMPFLYGGTMYVPYIMFDSSVTGVNLGVFASNSNRAVMIYSRANGALMFDLAADTATTSLGGSFSQTAVIRNSMVFIPINVVCDYFEETLNWTFLVDEADYYIVRVTSNSAVYSDADFVPRARFIMTPRYNAYIRSLAPPVSNDPPAPRPTTPVQPNGGTIYLAFRCNETGDTAPLAAALRSQRAYGLFFFRQEDLAARDDEVRALAAAGHRIGLLLDGEDSDAMETQLAEGNRLLGHILRTQTSLVLPENAGEVPEGQFVWTTTVDGTAEHQSTAARQIRDILRQVSGEEESFVLLDDSARSAEILERLLTGLEEEGCDLRLAVETVLA